MKTKTVKLKDISKPKQWKNLPMSKLKDTGYPVYGANGIIGYYDEYNHEFPTLAITCRGATCGNVHLTHHKSYITSNAMALDDVNTEEVYLDYLKHILKFRGFNDVITGAAQPQITRKNLEKIKLTIPKSKDDQIKIANLLTQIEALIAKRKESIKLLDELLKSTFLDMFGDPVLNPKGWDTVTIEDIVKKEKYSIKRGPFGGALKKEIFVSDGYLVYEQFHALNNDFSMARYFITEEKFQELKAFEVKSGDIIISCSGVYLGKLAIVPPNIKKGIINQALLKISLDKDKMNNILFTYIFRNENFIHKFFGSNRGAGIPNFPPMKEFKKFKFIKPPKPLQNKFTTIVQQVENTKRYYKKSLNKLNELFGSLSQRAFHGELDLSKMITIKVSDTSALDVSSSRAEDLKELLNVSTFVRKEIVEEKDDINQKNNKNMTSEELNKLIEELNTNRKSEPKKDIEELLLQLLNGNIALNAKEKGNLISGFTFGEIRDKLFELLDNKKITQTFVYKPHSKAEKEIAYVGLKQK